MATVAVVRQTMERRFVSVAEAEEITGISRWSWRAWSYSGKVASVKAGGTKRARLLIPVSEIDRIMNEGLRPARNDRAKQ